MVVVQAPINVKRERSSSGSCAICLALNAHALPSANASATRLFSDIPLCRIRQYERSERERTKTTERKNEDVKKVRRTRTRQEQAEQAEHLLKGIGFVVVAVGRIRHWRHEGHPL
jgi:hypothetical protein